jgi:hypothetical protein
MPLNSNQTAVDRGVRSRPHLGDEQTSIPSMRHTHFKILADGQMAQWDRLSKCSTSPNQIFALGMMPGY